MPPSLSVVVPAYNESLTLRGTVEELLDGLDARTGSGALASFELIVVENGSGDRTRELAEDLALRHATVRSLSLPRPDYGAALRAGIRAAEGDLVACFDADCYDLGFLDRALLHEHADVVVGSKRAAGASDRRPWGRRMVTAAFAAILRVGFGLHVSDTHGMKLLRRVGVADLVPRCRFTADLFDTELVVRAVRSGLAVEELPVAVQERRPPRTPVWTRIPRTLLGLARLRLALAAERRYRSRS